MSPRPRTVSDEHILQATQRVMSRLGPTRLTLAAVASEAGLAAATLVQRFGSKRGLMRALWASALDGRDGGCFDARLPANRSAVDALVDAATMMARGTKSADELANSLAFLQIDLTDPEFYPNMLTLSEQTEAGYRALLDEAVRRREIVKCDTARLARAVHAMAGGSLVAWGVFRKGNAERWVRTDLDTLIGPYRARPGRPARSPRADRR
jgi:AcrR family transcriptional regulator